MLIFREIEDTVSLVKSSLAYLGTESDSTLEEQRLKLLLRIVDYVNSFEWLTHVKTRDKIRAFLQSRYNYQTTAEKFGVSVKSLHVSVSYASSLLKKRLGCTLTLLEANNIIAAEREFLIGTGRCAPSDMFLGGIDSLFTNFVKNTGVDLETCGRELRFLAFFTSENIDRLIGTLNREKVSHLLYILLTNDISYVSERGILTCCLKGEIEAKEAINLLKSDFIYGSSTTP